MAGSSGFKQVCPACEAALTIRDPKVIGKKIECPRCKMKFVVEKPADAAASGNGAAAAARTPARGEAVKKPANEREAELDKRLALAKNGAGKAGDKTKTPAKVAEKPSKPLLDDEPLLEDEEPLLEDELPAEGDADEEPAAKKGKNGKKADNKAKKDKAKTDKKAKKDAKETPVAEGEEGGKKKKKKKKALAANSKMVMGMALGGVGVIVLIVAAIIMMSSGDGPKPSSPPPGTFPIITGGVDGQGGDGQGGNTNTTKTQNTKTNVPTKAAPKYLGPAELATLTNLLPGDSQHVANIPVATWLESTIPTSKFRNSAEYFDLSVLETHLGFSVAYVDRLLRAENYQYKWAYNVIHSTRSLDETAIVKALGLEEVKDRPAGFAKYYQLKKSNPLLDQLGRLAVTDRYPMSGESSIASDRPLYVCLHKDQYLIVADYVPMQTFLENKGKFPIKSRTTTPVKTPAPTPQIKPAPQPGIADPLNPPADPGDANPNLAGEDPMKKAPPPPAQPNLPVQPREEPSTPPTELYMTIDPDLKKVLDKVEDIAKTRSSKLLFSSATLLTSDALRETGNPLLQNQFLWKMRQMWDVTALLEESKPKLDVLGVALIQKDHEHFIYRNALICRDEDEAREVKSELLDTAVPVVIRFFEEAMGHKVELYRKKPPMPKVVDPQNTEPNIDPMGIEGQPPMPQPKIEVEEAATASRIEVRQNYTEVFFTLDVIFGEEEANFRNTAALLMVGLKAKLELVAEGNLHRLGQATGKLGKEGIPRHEGTAGKFPNGVFPRVESGKRIAQEPIHRVSFLAGLLPHLGRQTLFEKIDTNYSWKDQTNWLAARTLVPEFQSANYPPHLRMVSYPGLPMDVAATHFVGIAGIGPDAASYPDDSSFADRLGVFGYERSASLDAIQKGRGLSNTGVMIQVAPDNPSGMTPWIAGGGSTLRGVPEKDSLKPFASDHGSLGRGTYLLMADGSVRFVKEGVSDPLFQSMVTYKGAPPKSNELDEWAPRISPSGKIDVVKNTTPPENNIPEPKPAPKPDPLANWEKLDNKKEGISIFLPPGNPEFKPIPKAGGGIEGVEIERVLENGQGVGLQIRYLDKKIDPAGPAGQAWFDSVEKPPNPAIKMVGEAKKIVLDQKYPGREILLRGKNNSAIMRVYVTEDRVFFLQASKEGTNPQTPEAKAFLESFTLKVN
jgi:hypothetical protein